MYCHSCPPGESKVQLKSSPHWLEAVKDPHNSGVKMHWISLELKANHKRETFAIEQNSPTP